MIGLTYEAACELVPSDRLTASLSDNGRMSFEIEDAKGHKQGVVLSREKVDQLHTALTISLQLTALHAVVEEEYEEAEE